MNKAKFQKLFKGKMAKYFAGLILAVLILLVVGIWLVMAGQLAYQEKIYPGVMVGDLALGGKTKSQARDFLRERVKPLDQGVEFSYQDKKIVISPSSVSFDGDLAYQLFAIDVDKTAAAAYQISRDRSAWSDWQRKLTCWLWSCAVPLAVDYNQPKVIELLKQEFAAFEAPAADAALVWQPDGSWTVSKEKFGHRFDYQAATVVFFNNLARVKNNPIRLILEEEAPKIFQAEVGDLNPSINKFLDAAPLTFKFEDKTWVVGQADIRAWLGLKTDYQAGGKNVVADIDEALLKKYLDRRMGAELNQVPREAKFAMKDGRVSLFQSARDGQEIDAAATALAIRQAVAEGNQEVRLAVKISKSELADANWNDLGITEIIGTGTSSFAGSPVNRRHNIKVGAAALNGLLIKPGEEFSLLKALGKVDAKAGYLPELVIKENKTTPEFGGGLCQIGTTLFRTVFHSGLPVTMRRNHSYRVQYYEPAGTDATIYDPWPDFRFVNDTGNYILIETRLEGNIATFDFWGKPDGRKVEYTYPTIYGIVKPAPTKIIETLDLKPGEKKCTERAHNGASAYFDYKVTYPSGETKETRFASHYVPWQEVCLLGVEKLSEPSADGQLPPANPDAANVVAPTSTAQ